MYMVGSGILRITFVWNIFSKNEYVMKYLPYGQKIRKSAPNCRIFYAISADFEADMRK